MLISIIGACIILLCLVGDIQPRAPDCVIIARSSGKVSCIGQDLHEFLPEDWASLFDNDKVREIELINCTVSSLNFLNSDRLRALRNLTLIRVDGLGQGLTAAMFSYAYNITTLTFRDIPQLTSIDFIKDMSRRLELRELTIEGTGITSIDKFVFSRVPFLKKLSVSSNNLRSLDITEIIRDTQLKSLLARGNQIENLLGSLNALLVLEEIDLSDNRLSNVATILDTLPPQLKRLNLSSNNLNAIQVTSRDVTDVTELYINDNIISQIGPLAPRFGKLQILHAENNEGLKLSDNTLGGLPDLRELYISKSGLTRITSELQNLPSLRRVELQGNALTAIHQNAFLGTTSLESISLQNNRLTSADFTSSSVRLNRLLELDMSNNTLVELGSLAFAPLLRTLRVEGNPFTRLSGCGLTGQLRSLRVLCITDISPPTCRYASFTKLLTKDSNILYNNPYCCADPNHTCCSNPTSCSSNYPEQVPGQCPSDEDLCATPPDGTLPAMSTVSYGKSCEPRTIFSGLYDGEIVVALFGYILAVLLAVIVAAILLKRHNSYSQWLKDMRQRDQQMAGMESNQNGINMTSKGQSLPCKGKSPSQSTVHINGTIYEKCEDYIGSPASKLKGRDKFSTSSKHRLPKPISASPSSSIRYPSLRAQSTCRSQDEQFSDEDTLSVYSYAERIPGLAASPPTTVSTVTLRSKSESMLSAIPSIVIERKASDTPAISADPIPGSPKSMHSLQLHTKLENPQIVTIKQMHNNSGAPSPPSSRRFRRQMPVPSSGEDTPTKQRSLESELGSADVGSPFSPSLSNDVFFDEQSK